MWPSAVARRACGRAGVLAHLLRPDLAELPEALSNQGLELGVVQKAVEVLELLPAQLQLLNPQAGNSAHGALE